mmetsp:Transcript_12528/g.18918  ORF Transcript_12528/g.18918 Transcript_12528/m.18918 type:complete len:386 (+) Transcript_12528:525-1682(+)
MAIREDEAIDLGLDVNDLGGSSGTGNINLIVKVTNVSNNSVVLHLGHVGSHNDILVTSGCDEDVSETDDSAQVNNRESFHGSLKSTDRINFGHIDNSTSSLKSLSASLSNITVSADNASLSGNHDISSTHKSIRERVLATVKVVKLTLCDRVIDVDGGEKKLVLLGHNVKSVDTSGGLLRNTNHTSSNLLPLGGVLREFTADNVQNAFEFRVLGRVRIGEASIDSVLLLVLNSLVDEESDISSIVDNEVGSISLVILRPGDSIQSALPVLLQGLTLPGKNGGRVIASDSGSSVILGGEDVARAPSDIGTESLQGLNKDCSLDGHVKRASNTSTLKQGRGELLTASHQTRHFALSDLNFLATEVSKRDVSNTEITRSHFCKVLLYH